MSSGGAAMGEEEVKAMVDSFVGITSAGRDEAAFFLESHNFNLDSAVQSFYDDPPPVGEEVEGGSEEEQQGEEVPDEEDEQNNDVEEEEDEQDDEDYLPSENEEEEKKKGKGKGSNSRLRVRSISDLKRKADSDIDTDSDDDSELDGQDFYTGGEKSGMVVRDPSKRHKINKNSAQAIFEQARKMASKPGPSKKPGSSSKSFKGKARTLADEDETPAENPFHNVYFWRNGFTVNDGPLRAFNDPQNASFLESIKKSECPDELKPSDDSSEIAVNLIRKESNYPVPKKRGKQNGAFRGKPRTIGEESPSESSPTPVPDRALSITSTGQSSVNNKSPVPPVESLPGTSLQIRLTDGTRLVSRFNMNNTVGDIRAFIDLSRPGGASFTYRLQTVGFPPKELDDVSMTIEELGIGNSVVIQKV